MPVTSGVAVGFTSRGASGAAKSLILAFAGTTGSAVLALIDCSACRAFHTTAQPSPITTSTSAAVRRIPGNLRSSLGLDPGASIGAALKFSTGSGIGAMLTNSARVACFAVGAGVTTGWATTGTGETTGAGITTGAAATTGRGAMTGAGVTTVAEATSGAGANITSKMIFAGIASEIAAAAISFPA